MTHPAATPAQSLNPGKLVVLEGIDGAGKSTHVRFIADCIRRAHGVQVLVTREPGGTPLAESIRGLLLHEPMDAQTEVLLAMAARLDHVQGVIRPALASGQWVVCDRFVDSTRAYQGGGGGVDLAWIDALNQVATRGLNPDRVYLFDAPSEIAAKRRGGRITQDGPTKAAGHGTEKADRFESQGIDFFDRIRDVYLHQQRANSAGQILIVDSTLSVPQIQSLLSEDISTL